MSPGLERTYRAVGLWTLAALNVAVFVFYATWWIADNEATARVETDTSVDFSQMLPNANLMWLAAHATLLLVILLDVVAVKWMAESRKSRRRPDEPVPWREAPSGPTGDRRSR